MYETNEDGYGEQMYQPSTSITNILTTDFTLSFFYFRFTFPVFHPVTHFHFLLAYIFAIRYEQHVFLVLHNKGMYYSLCM